MILREFKVWGGKREENDSLYIWAKDADDAIGIARLTDQSICISQWTGNEKSYEEAIKLVKEVTGMSLDWDDAHYEALQMAIKALEKEPKWIPCSERLPEKNVEVLATTEWSAVTIAEMYSANDWFIHEGTTNAEIDEIVAWMPLPEPYKAGM